MQSLTLFQSSLGSLSLWLLIMQTATAESAAVVAVKAQAAIDRGQTPEWWTMQLPDEIQRDVHSKGKRLAEQLGLGDESKTLATAQLISEHFGRVWAWHQQADARLDKAWKAWDTARDTSGGKQKDEHRALAIMTEQIDPIYAEFAPQIYHVFEQLQQLIGAKATTQLLDQITRSPGAKRTYDAYVSMVPEMTEEQKSILWERMVQARHDSLAAWSDKEIVKIFKKYKVQNEFSIDYFGYGYRGRYEAWAKSQK